MKSNHPEEKFSDDPTENLHIENQILRLKMQAESGAFFGHEDHELPPEVENDFLKQVQAFEDAWQHVKQVTVHELLGRPAHKPANMLTDAQLEKELQKLFDLMEAHDVYLDMIGTYDSRIIYRFI